MVERYYLKKPDSAFTYSRPRYSELFSYEKKSDRPAATDDEYTTDNFVSWLPRQSMAFDVLSDTDLRIPIWARQKPDSKSEYTVCSYKAMMNTKPCHIFALLAKNYPLHFFADFDLPNKEEDATDGSSGSTQRFIVPAMLEAEECIKIVLAGQIETNPAFKSLDGKFTMSVVYAHKKKKQSAHVVYHLSNLAMFKDIEHCRYFYNLVIQENNKRFPNKADNPLYFFENGEYTCIMDWQVYSMNRLFRMAGQYKNDGKFQGMVAPYCGTDKMVCDNLECVVHAYHQLSEQDYCANDMRFIPRNANDVPFIVDILTMPESLNPILKRNHANFALLNGNSNSNGVIIRENTVSRSPIMRESTTLSSNPAVPKADEQRYRIMRLIATIIATSTQSQCSFTRFEKNATEFGLISSLDTMCPYKYKRCRANNNFDCYDKNGRKLRVDHDKQLAEHGSNHICYLAKILFPMPLVYISCPDEKCVGFRNSSNGLRTMNINGNGSAHATLNLSNISEELTERYMEMTNSYFLGFKFHASFFSLPINFKSAGKN